AHYDHIWISIFTSYDRIMNGANDNASGVAMIIELAKYYKALDNNRYTLCFVAFSGEELGLLGSRAFAFSVNKEQVHAVINFDMVGRPISKRKQYAMVIGERADDIIARLNAQLQPENKF